MGTHILKAQVTFIQVHLVTIRRVRLQALKVWVQFLLCYMPFVQLGVQRFFFPMALFLFSQHNNIIHAFFSHFLALFIQMMSSVEHGCGLIYEHSCF